MKKSARIVKQKYLCNFSWNDMEFHKYLIEFQDDDNVYTINREVSLEQSLIDANIIYTLGGFNDIKNYKILCYESDKKHVLLSRKDLFELARQIALNMLKKNGYDTTRMAERD